MYVHRARDLSRAEVAAEVAATRQGRRGGAPGNWHSHHLSRGGTPRWAKLHRPLRALAQSPLRPRQTTCPRSDGARRPPTLKFGVTVVRRGRGPRILKFRCVRPIARSPRSDRANDDGNDDGNTGSLTSQITSANLEIEIHKPRRACRQTLPAEFTNLGLHLSEPSKSFFKPPLQCGRTQGFMLPNLCFFTAKPKVNVQKWIDREVVTYPPATRLLRR